MNFDLSEEQSLLRDMVARFGADHYDASRRLQYLRQPCGFSTDNWSMLAETGLLAFALPEEAGGFGGSDVDIITVMETLGDFAAVEPFLASVIGGCGAVWQAGTEEQRAHLIPQFLSGERFAALALHERNARYGFDGIQCKAIGDGDEIRLTGHKQIVLGGGFATDLVIAARTEPHSGINLYLVDANALGSTRRNYRLVDGSVASDIVLDHVPASPMKPGGAALASVLQQMRLAISGELVGLMGLMFRDTLDYLKTRKQFGQSLGSFQAIQHRMADCYAKLELARSQLYRAAAFSHNPAEREKAIVGAKAFISRAAIHVGEEAVQLHGGIGTTEELLVGQAFKRVMTLSMLLGDSDTDVARYVALSAVS